MRWVKRCCDKVENMFQNEYGAWQEKGVIGGQKITNEKHAQMQAMQTAYRKAVQDGDVDRVLDIKFKEGYV